MVFINPKEAYQKIPRDLIWWILNKRNASRDYIDIIKYKYKGVITSVRITCGETCEFPMTIGLHQGSALGHYLLELIMS